MMLVGMLHPLQVELVQLLGTLVGESLQEVLSVLVAMWEYPEIWSRASVLVSVWAHLSLVHELALQLVQESLSESQLLEQ